MIPELRLKPGKEVAVRAGHPWIFSGAFEALDPRLEPGSLVDVRAASGEFVARGYVNPRCTIAVRVLTWGEEPVDAGFVRRRVAAAVRWRRRWIGNRADAYRVLNGEGDGLPGVVVDVYGRFAVLQCLTAGADRLKGAVLDALRAELPLAGIFERSSGAVRRQEGLPSIDAVAWGEPPPPTVEIREHGHAFAVDVRGGQKTGFFLDQRENRALVERLASGARVLDAFSYSGSFAVHAACGGAARVVAVETSAPALALAERNWAKNGLDPGRCQFVRGDVFEYLRRTEETFDLLVLDPPPLARRRSEVPAALRAYRDLNLWAFRRAAPGALVLTFTCSQHVDSGVLRKVVQSAAARAGWRVQVLAALGAAADHPAGLAHPEGWYLHGFLLRVVERLRGCSARARLQGGAELEAGAIDPPGGDVV